MSERLDGLLENATAASLKQLAADIQDLRERQIIAGNGGVLTYDFKSAIAPSWDVVQTVTNQTLTLTLTLNTDGSQRLPVAIVYADIFVNGTDETHRIPNGLANYVDAAATVVSNNNGSPSPTSDYVLSNRITLKVTGTATIYFRFSGTATCPMSSVSVGSALS